jgi:hypothetical protein
MLSIDGAVVRLICPHVLTRFGAWSTRALKQENNETPIEAQHLAGTLAMPNVYLTWKTTDER